MISKIAHKWRRFRYRHSVPQLTAREGGYAAMGQDIFVADLLGGKRGGVFVDIGASDGVTVSNTLYFERTLGWKGLAVEPIPSIFAQLASNRTCALINGCITDHNGKQNFTEVVDNVHMLSGLTKKMDPRHKRRIRRSIARLGRGTAREIEVNCVTWASALAAHSISTVDFLSLDTEGGELDILKSIDFRLTPVRIISVENNFFTHDIHDYLVTQGFNRLGAFSVDEIYVAKHLL